MRPGPALLAACADQPARGTLAQLHDVEPDVEEVKVEQGLETAMQSYRRYLEETPRTEMTPEAMRRLADLQIEKQFGIRGDGEIKEMAAPEEAGGSRVDDDVGRDWCGSHRVGPGLRGTRNAGQCSSVSRGDAVASTPPGASEPPPAGPLEAIALYDRLLAEYPDYGTTTGWSTRRPGHTTSSGAPKRRRWISSSGLPASMHYDEVQFRRAEYFLHAQEVPRRESAYQSIIAMGASSSYYELALYKQGWTLYKQEFYEEAQHRSSRFSTTRSRSATTSNSSTTRTRNGESRTPSA